MSKIKKKRHKFKAEQYRPLKQLRWGQVLIGELSIPY